MNIKNIIVEIIRYIVVFLIALCVLGLVVVNKVKITILDKEYIFNKVEESEYYLNIFDEVYSEFSNYTMQSGFDNSILSNIVSQSKVIDDTNIIINNIYDGSTQKVETTSIRENLDRNIEDFLNQNGLTAEKNSLNEFDNLIVSTYTGTINSYEKVETIGNKLLVKANNIIDKLNRILKVIVVILVLVLISISIFKYYKLIVLAGDGMLFAGVLTIIGKLFVNSLINFNNLLILNKSLTATLKYIYEDITGGIISLGIVFGILGIILIFVGNYLYLKSRDTKYKLLNKKNK